MFDLGRIWGITELLLSSSCRGGDRELPGARGRESELRVTPVARSRPALPPRYLAGREPRGLGQLRSTVNPTVP